MKGNAHRYWDPRQKVPDPYVNIPVIFTDTFWNQVKTKRHQMRIVESLKPIQAKIKMLKLRFQNRNKITKYFQKDFSSMD